MKNKNILRLPQIHYIIQPKIFCNVNKIICTFIRRKEQQWPGIRERYRAGSSPSGSQLYKPEFISPSSHKISLFFSFFHPFANICREISRNIITTSYIIQRTCKDIHLGATKMPEKQLQLTKMLCSIKGNKTYFEILSVIFENLSVI